MIGNVTFTWKDGDRVELRPRDGNLLHKKPVMATYQGGYFYCDGSDPRLGPDYYLGDVLTYCEVIGQ